MQEVTVFHLFILHKANFELKKRMSDLTPVLIGVSLIFETGTVRADGEKE